MTELEFRRQFNADWKAGQSPEVHAILAIEPDMLRRAEAAVEAMKANPALKIDTFIVIWNGEPWLTHLLRTTQGIPYVGNFEGIGYGTSKTPFGLYTRPWPAVPILSLPTVDFGASGDLGDPSTWPGVLDRLHSLYPKDALLPAPVPVPVPGPGIVGGFMAPGLRGAGVNARPDTVENGKAYPDETGKLWTAQISTGLMGWTCTFVPKL